ncbi:No apical meristem (NAM) protein [Corchorus olitorius]|uniref:No apical meristem (NAM) protein n=1 Tax=Corchorus olitorius TaxID=93759 RepID=A0A1R3I5W5_9ROSI|nr:No apical meristem (NAM) protein [Corchorus olitorius]
MEQNNYYYEQNSMQNPSGAASYCNGVIINNGIHERGMNDINEEDYFNSFPPGFRFCPEDIELIEDYLKKKVNGENLPPNKICVVELYQKHPSELAEDEAYGSGYWKPTGKDKPIQNTCGRAVGYKRTLDFYQGKHPTGLKTDWKMHEYRLTQTQNPNPNDMTAI